MHSPAELGFGLRFPQLYTRDGLIAVDEAFLTFLSSENVSFFNRLMAARQSPEAIDNKEESDLLINIASVLEIFLGKLFGIESEINTLVRQHVALSPLYACKRLFVQRRAAKGVLPAEASAIDGEALESELVSYIGEALNELSFATHVMQWLEKPDVHVRPLEAALHYAAWALHSVDGIKKHRSGILFRVPKKLDPLHLVAVETEIHHGVRMLKLPDSHLRSREGFALTDAGGSLAKALDEANYCLFCHHQEKDSCAKGLKEKDGSFKKSSLHVTLAGCPLEEKISEMNQLKSEAVPLGALAVAIVDNPMLAGTGHRICNDCMKSCIYQKQEPVNIPLQETRTLQDVLQLPWGFEIYSLLTRWNPLNIRRSLPRPATGRKVLIAGMGPAGYTLAHHLMNDGHIVVGIDGLKIEPLPQDVVNTPIRDVNALYESLDHRVLAGFGGVAEYGITVRWDKNYLKLIRLLLERREQFAMFGGVRFGGTLTYNDAFALGFDHIALAMGAGRPTLLEVPGAVRLGVRAASDFLMALQLTGAAKEDSIANLQLRLPVIVIGGGLTAIDTATESLAYYPVQVEKFLQRYETLLREKGESTVRTSWNEMEAGIADEFIAHAHAIRAEREEAKREHRPPDLLSLLKSWGGVTIAYRRRLTDAPSYRLNHEEVEKAMEEGIFFAEGLEPTHIDADEYGHVNQVRFSSPDGEIILPARAVLVAAGTSPNTVLAQEDAAHFHLDGKFFQAVDEQGVPVSPERIAKPAAPHMLLAREADGRTASFFGDLHPSFAGNVVKAMGSAKQGYPIITRLLNGRLAANNANAEEFLTRMRELLTATVQEVNRLTPTIVEVVIKAPLAARNFCPGQFYRLQNFESTARRVPLYGTVTTLAMEGLAMTGAWMDEKRGLIGTIVLEMGGSSDLCAYLQPGEHVVMMGPTGEATDLPKNETVLLVGGGLGNAVLLSIGKGLRENNCRVLYFAGYRTHADRYKQQDIEQAADIVVWACDESPGFTPSRQQDAAYIGNMVEAMRAYGEGRLGKPAIPLFEVQRIIAIGSDRMMAAVAAARHGSLKKLLNPFHIAIGSINSPMQCMMKEICAQCLQLHVDPVTGKEHYVFSCANQDQALDRVNFAHLAERLAQNAVQEKLTAQWIDACLRGSGLRRHAA